MTISEQAGLAGASIEAIDPDLWAAMEGERRQAVIVEVGEHGREAGARTHAARGESRRDRLDLLDQLGVGEAAVAPVVDQRELARRAMRRHRHQVPGAPHHGVESVPGRPGRSPTQNGLNHTRAPSSCVTRT